MYIYDIAFTLYGWRIIIEPYFFGVRDINNVGSNHVVNSIVVMILKLFMVTIKWFLSSNVSSL